MSLPKLNKGDLRKSHKIPLYGVLMDLIVTTNIGKARWKYNRILGECNEWLGNTYGLHSYSGPYSALFLRRLKGNYVSHDVIAHEIFHATLYVMDKIGARTDKIHDEPAAHLNGWLTTKVYEDLKTWGIKVK